MSGSSAAAGAPAASINSADLVQRDEEARGEGGGCVIDGALVVVEVEWLETE
jgi:hypothetical protein